MDRLTIEQYWELEAQMERMDKDVPGEHLNLIALLNRLGFNPMSKQEAMHLAKRLLYVTRLLIIEENGDE
jgi:hypothetical protein